MFFTYAHLGTNLTSRTQHESSQLQGHNNQGAVASSRVHTSRFPMGSIVFQNAQNVENAQTTQNTSNTLAMSSTGGYSMSDKNMNQQQNFIPNLNNNNGGIKSNYQNSFGTIEELPSLPDLSKLDGMNQLNVHFSDNVQGQHGVQVLGVLGEDFQQRAIQSTQSTQSRQSNAIHQTDNINILSSSMQHSKQHIFVTGNNDFQSQQNNSQLKNGVNDSVHVQQKKSKQSGKKSPNLLYSSQENEILNKHMCKAIESNRKKHSKKYQYQENVCTVNEFKKIWKIWKTNRGHNQHQQVKKTFMKKLNEEIENHNGNCDPPTRSENALKQRLELICQGNVSGWDMLFRCRLDTNGVCQPLNIKSDTRNKNKNENKNKNKNKNENKKSNNTTKNMPKSSYTESDWRVMKEKMDQWMQKKIASQHNKESESMRNGPPYLQKFGNMWRNELLMSSDDKKKFRNQVRDNVDKRSDGAIGIMITRLIASEDTQGYQRLFYYHNEMQEYISDSTSSHIDSHNSSNGENDVDENGDDNNDDDDDLDDDLDDDEYEQPPRKKQRVSKHSYDSSSNTTSSSMGNGSQLSFKQSQHDYSYSNTEINIINQELQEMEQRYRKSDPHHYFQSNEKMNTNSQFDQLLEIFRKDKSIVDQIHQRLPYLKKNNLISDIEKMIQHRNSRLKL